MVRFGSLDTRPRLINSQTARTARSTEKKTFSRSIPPVRPARPPRTNSGQKTRETRPDEKTAATPRVKATGSQKERIHIPRWPRAQRVRHAQEHAYKNNKRFLASRHRHSRFHPPGRVDSSLSCSRRACLQRVGRAGRQPRAASSSDCNVTSTVCERRRTPTRSRQARLPLITSLCFFLSQRPFGSSLERYALALSSLDCSPLERWHRYISPGQGRPWLHSAR